MTLSYQTLTATLERLDVPLPLSETHGLCCGLLCSMPSSAAKTRWFTELLDAASVSPEAVAEHAGELKQLDDWFSETISALNDSDLEFSPAMPEDSAPAAVRIRALGDFCGGFTYGIGIALGQRSHKPLPEDCREIVSDFQEIEAVEISDADADEATFTELLEYVRVGVLLMLEELRPVSPATSGMNS